MTSSPIEPGEDFWDQRFREHDGYAYGRDPHSFIASHASRVVPGARALAVADGEGRHAVWLAGLGADVLMVDWARAGLTNAEALAAEKGVCIRTHCVDLASWRWPRDSEDVVVVAYAHFGPRLRPGMHRSMLRALKPGGVVLLVGFHRDQQQFDSGGPREAEFLFTEEMLREDFAGAEVVELRSYRDVLDEGPFHQGMAALVGLVARRT